MSGDKPVPAEVVVAGELFLACLVGVVVRVAVLEEGKLELGAVDMVAHRVERVALHSFLAAGALEA